VFGEHKCIDVAAKAKAGVFVLCAFVVEVEDMEDGEEVAEWGPPLGEDVVVNACFVGRKVRMCISNSSGKALIRSTVGGSDDNILSSFRCEFDYYAH
jgi:hypothetical protein